MRKSKFSWLIVFVALVSTGLNACGSPTTTTLPSPTISSMPNPTNSASATLAPKNTVSPVTPTITTGPTQNFKPGLSREKLEFEGRERTYNVYLPPAITQNKPLPLVLILHPATSNADQMLLLTGFNRKAETDGYIAVYPNGTGRREGDIQLYWNVGYCCSAAMTNKVNDVGFLKALVGKLETTYPLDPKRFYITGMSNGGMMTYLLGAELADKVAALGPVVGAMGGNETLPKSPVSVIAFNGTSDPIVPYNGFKYNPRGPGLEVSGDFKPVSYAEEFWAKANKANPTPQKEETDKVLKETFNGDAPFIQYSVKGGGHSWYGAKILPEDSGISATDLIWEFFKSHPKGKF